MYYRKSSPLMLTVLSIAIVSGVFFLIRNRQASIGAGPQSDQTFYAGTPDNVTNILPTTASSTEKIDMPIVVYHIVRPSYPSDSRSVRAIAVTPETLDAEMKYLADAGYHVVSFHDLENYFRSGAALPEKPIIISFDDGWSDQFTYAFPILKKYHYTATFFVFTNPIGTRGFLTWDELKALRDAGMTIGAHTRSHPYLTKISNPAALWNEIVGGKQRLEKNLGITVNEFAYPFGLYNPAIVALVKKVGYASARGDYYYGAEQTADRLYELSALNAPTTTVLFARRFRAHTSRLP